MKTTIILILLSLLSFNSHAQLHKKKAKGFMGKCNYLTADLFDPVFQGLFEIKYERCLTKNLTVYAGGKFGRRSYDSVTTQVLQYDPFGGGSYWDDRNGTATAGGKSFLIGIHAGSGYANLALPVGYYYGYFFEKGFYHITDVTGSGSTAIEREFPVSLNLIGIDYGRSVYLGSNFTFDWSIQLGVRWGRIKESTDYVFPSVIYPADAISDLFLSYYEKTFKEDKGFTSYVGFYVMPRLRVGYIF